MTVEQLWQPTPGGSGTYVRELLRAYATDHGVDPVGIAAWHRTRPPPRACGIDRAARPSAPTRALPVVAARPTSPDRAGRVLHATTWAYRGVAYRSW